MKLRCKASPAVRLLQLTSSDLLRPSPRRTVHTCQEPREKAGQSQCEVPESRGEGKEKHFVSHLCYDIVNYHHNFSFAVPISSKKEFLFL